MGPKQKMPLCVWGQHGKISLCAWAPNKKCPSAYEDSMEKLVALCMEGHIEKCISLYGPHIEKCFFEHRAKYKDVFQMGGSMLLLRWGGGRITCSTGTSAGEWGNSFATDMVKIVTIPTRFSLWQPQSFNPETWNLAVFVHCSCWPLLNLGTLMAWHCVLRTNLFSGGKLWAKKRHKRREFPYSLLVLYCQNTPWSENMHCFMRKNAITFH